MSRPHVLPHAAIDEFVERSGLSDRELHGPHGLYPALARALSKGARVVLVLWEAPDWQLLAIQPPEDAADLSDLEILGRVDGWPELVAEMLRKSRRGAHYTWLDPRRHPAHSNATH